MESRQTVGPGSIPAELADSLESTPYGGMSCPALMQELGLASA